MNGFGDASSFVAGPSKVSVTRCQRFSSPWTSTLALSGIAAANSKRVALCTSIGPQNITASPGLWKNAEYQAAADDRVENRSLCGRGSVKFVLSWTASSYPETCLWRTHECARLGGCQSPEP